VTAPSAGDVVGHYRIDGTIGVGGMGVVHAATDLRLNRPAALKIVLGHHAASPEFAARFQREAAVLARLDSPHVVAIYDHGEHEGSPWIAMQYAAGGDLGTLLRRHGPMPYELAAKVCAQVADALVAAHGAGVVHRDVKPANVLLRDDRADRVHVYLSDFGVALTEATGLTSPGAVAGTWNYLAPERTRGEPGSPASDVYAVGCLLHELVTGRPPYEGSDVEVAMEHLSAPVPTLPAGQQAAPGDGDEVRRSLDRVLALTMAKEPHERYPSAAALRDDLRVVAGTVTGATPVPGGAPLGADAAGSARARRRRGLVAVAAVAVVAVVGGATGLALATGADSPAGTDGDPPSSTSPATAGTSAPTSAAPEPEVASYVTGDLDGDGRGDVAWSDFDRSHVALSGSGGFGEPARRPVPGRDVVVGDLDGDGVGDLVEIGGSVPALVVTVHARGGRRELPTAVVDTPPSPTEIDPDFIAADVDGDGLDDLVVATAPNPRTTVLTVALSRGDGTFGRSRPWYRGPLDARQAGWAVGDMDGDGDDDLVHHETVDQRYDVRRAQVLASSGSAEDGFGVVGRPLRVPEDLDGYYFSVERLDVGDVDGDGEPEVVGLEPYGFDAVVWEWSGSRFDSGRFWTSTALDFDRPGDEGRFGTLTDVDGDGLADVVTLGTDDRERGVLEVHLSTGTSFRHAPGRRTVLGRIGDGALVDRVKLGIY
jgi:hypothetical protein